MVPLSTLLAIVMLMVLRKHMSRKVVLAGMIVFALLFLVERIVQPTNASGALINALLIAFQAMAGIVLLTHTRLTTIRLYDGQIRNAFQSLCWGCLLALPPALFNIASLTNSLLTDSDRRFDHWWKAVYALQPALLEETWAHLFLLTLCYAVLRPTSRQKPQRALTAALIISVCIHGLAHYPQSLANPLFIIGVMVYCLMRKRNLSCTRKNLCPMIETSRVRTPSATSCSSQLPPLAAAGLASRLIAQSKPPIRSKGWAS
jgi:hypothetical protein